MSSKKGIWAVGPALRAAGQVVPALEQSNNDEISNEKTSAHYFSS